MDADTKGIFEAFGSLIATVVGGLLLIFSLMSCTNSCSADEWNDGICERCNIAYELRAVSNGIHYYICPECHCEVSRY